MGDVQNSVRSVATIATPQAQRYLSQLCKHFQHRRPVTLEATAGHIGFDAGNCDLLADDTALILTATAADAEALQQLQDVIARHLLRFAFREAMRIDWQPA
jgi:hypothetical protein